MAKQSSLKWKDKRLVAVMNTELTDLPCELWKDIPDFPGYQLSCFGRAKSLGREIVHSSGKLIMRKPRILKLRILKIDKSSDSTIVTMTLFRDRKTHTFSVARCVYHLFVRQIDLSNKSMLVVKKDKDPLNCFSKNLRLEIPQHSTKKYMDAFKAKMSSQKKLPPVLNIDIESLEHEEWRAVPNFDDKYLLSNYGRLKSVSRQVQYKTGRIAFHKEKIHKLAISPLRLSKDQFGIYVTLMRDEKSYRYSIPRLVYQLFVRSFDTDNSKLLITHEDGNSLNCFYKNLELKTGSQIKEKLFRTKGTELFFKNIVKAVHQYDFKGDWIRTYSSVSKASEETGISVSRINNAINRKQLQDHKFYWQNSEKVRKLDVSQFNAKERKHLESIKRAVQQLSMEDKILRTFESITDATKAMGFKSTNSIAQVCKGFTNSSNGYKWRYSEGTMGPAKTKNLPRQVNQYSATGEFIYKYDSFSQAAKAIGIVSSAIGNAVRLKYKTAKGFYWRAGVATKKIPVTKYASQRKTHLNSAKKMVQKYSLDGILLETYESLAQAANAMKTSGGAIRLACQDASYICKGYHWKFYIPQKTKNPAIAG